MGLEQTNKQKLLGTIIEINKCTHTLVSISTPLINPLLAAISTGVSPFISCTLRLAPALTSMSVIWWQKKDKTNSCLILGQQFSLVLIPHHDNVRNTARNDNTVRETAETDFFLDKWTSSSQSIIWWKDRGGNCLVSSLLDHHCCTPGKIWFHLSYSCQCAEIDDNCWLTVLLHLS